LLIALGFTVPKPIEWQPGHGRSSSRSAWRDDAHTELNSVTELEVIKAARRKRETERCVVGLQINYRHMLEGLPLVWSGSE
jgi:hypothetical protein